MREILFRGKRVDNGEWVKGFYVWDNPETIGVIENDESVNAGWLNEYEVIPKTVGQYTGYQEKKTGKMLFDGDNFTIETWEDNGRKSLAYFTVCWDNYGLRWMAKSFVDYIYNESLGDIIDDSLEIIGNIHDQKGDV